MQNTARGIGYPTEYRSKVLFSYISYIILIGWDIVRHKFIESLCTTFESLKSEVNIQICQKIGISRYEKSLGH